MRPRKVLAIAAALTPSALAYPQFTTPGAGASIAPGSIAISWKDDGTSPSLAQLSTYTIQLMVGGNTDSDSLALTTLVAQGTFSTGNSATGPAAATLAGPTKNGFYLKMIATATEGGTVTVYSDHFDMPAMTGNTPSQYETAVSALGGSTAGPAAVNAVSNGAAAPAAGAGAGFDVPYNLQTGLTRYAAMQSIPPTSITATNPTPLFPTSAYTIATTYLPQATGVLTTLTQPQTFVVSSVENTAAAQSQPSGDMAKFLARWKD